MTEHAFRQQHLTHAILGYSANPSVDPNAPAVLGSLEKAQANGFATIDTVKASKSSKKDLKRKRKAKGDLEIVDGDGAYEGPWAAWQGDEKDSMLPEGELDQEEEEDSDDSEEEVNPVSCVASCKFISAGIGRRQGTSAPTRYQQKDTKR